MNFVVTLIKLLSTLLLIALFSAFVYYGILKAPGETGSWMNIGNISLILFVLAAVIFALFAISAENILVQKNNDDFIKIITNRLKLLNSNTVNEENDVLNGKLSLLLEQLNSSGSNTHKTLNLGLQQLNERIDQLQDITTAKNEKLISSANNLDILAAQITSSLNMVKENTVPETDFSPLFERLNLLEETFNTQNAQTLQRIEQLQSEFKTSETSAINLTPLMQQIEQLSTAFHNMQQYIEQSINDINEDISALKQQTVLQTESEESGEEFEPETFAEEDNADIYEQIETSEPEDNADIYEQIETSEPEDNADIYEQIETSEPEDNADIYEQIETSEPEDNADIYEQIETSEPENNADIYEQIETSEPENNADIYEQITSPAPCPNDADNVFSENQLEETADNSSDLTESEKKLTAENPFGVKPEHDILSHVQPLDTSVNPTLYGSDNPFGVATDNSAVADLPDLDTNINPNELSSDDPFGMVNETTIQNVDEPAPSTDIQAENPFGMPINLDEPADLSSPIDLDSPTDLDAPLDWTIPETEHRPNDIKSQPDSENNDENFVHLDQPVEQINPEINDTSDVEKNLSKIFNDQLAADLASLDIMNDDSAQSENGTQTEEIDLTALLSEGLPK